MNKYHQRQRFLYNPKSIKPFAVSRSKIDLFLDCPKCFYLDCRLGLKRTSMPAFSLNSAVDALLKNEFDILRKQKKPHELMTFYKINAIPFDHKDIDVWRQNFVGKRYLHQGTNLEIFGAVDDLWVNPKGELLIVDYKSTSTSKDISLDDEWKQGYKKQMEVYQWIFKKSGFKVNDTGYFVFANAGKNRPKFDGKLEFVLSILSYKGDDSWVESTIFEMKKCLDSKKIPQSGADCEYCEYTEAVNEKTTN